jgi:recombination protein RecA
MPKTKQSDLKIVMEQIRKRHGAESVIQIGQHKLKPMEHVSSGSLGLDLAIGIGGIPKARIIEISGPEGGGKTTLCLQTVARAQAAGKFAAYIDAEHALNLHYAKSLGVDLDSLLFSQPDSGEQALDIAEQMITCGLLDIVVVDSVAALVPAAELNGEAGDQHMGLQARMMGQAMRRLAGVIRRKNIAAVFINQIREKMGVMFGSNEVTPGGRALKFFASLRIDIRRVADLKDGDQKIGARTKFRLGKNRCGLPFQEGEFDLIFGRGISREGEILDIALAEEIPTFERSGSWYAYQGERLGQGREGAKDYLLMNPSVAAAIEEAIKTKFREAGKLA